MRIAAMLGVAMIVAAPAIAGGGVSTTPPNIMMDSLITTPGHCLSNSNTASGPVGSDLTKAQSRFFCDTVVTTMVDNQPGHFMVEFVNKASPHSPMIGFGGFLQADHMLHVANLYMNGEKIPVDEGYCKFFTGASSPNGVFCGAKADEGGVRTAAIVAFNNAASGRSKN